MLLQMLVVFIGVVAVYFIVMGVTGNKLGFFFSGQLDKNEKTAGFNTVEHIFFSTVFRLLGYVARRDAPVNDKEIRRTETFMEKMHLNAMQRQQAIQLFGQGASPDFRIEKALRDFKGLSRKSPNLTQILLVYLVSLARVDGLLVSKEITAVQEIARALGYSNITFEQLLKMLSSQERFSDAQWSGAQEDTQRAYYEETANKTGDESARGKKRYSGFADEQEQSHCAYDALGLTPAASDTDVRKAYQKLASQFHPDKLIGQGLPPFMIKALTERFKYIQSAYDCIKREKAS